MTKGKRVRTGCLTCRERHLKCDEAVPDCINCRRSNRHCKRGLRLNFQDTMVYIPSTLPLSRDWAVLTMSSPPKVHFLDESRHIASEYRGGLKRYAGVGQHDCHGRAQPRTERQRHGADSGVGAVSTPSQSKSAEHSPRSKVANTRNMRQGSTALHPRRNLEAMAPPWTCSSMHIEVAYESLPEAEPCGQFSRMSDVQHLRANTSAGSDTSPRSRRPSDPSNIEPPVGQTPASKDSRVHGPVSRPSGSAVCAWDGVSAEEGREFIGTQEELEYMQAFVDGVGVWMDSLDHENHFGQVIPGRALESPLLWNALLACGAKHLSSANPKLDNKAECYFNTATMLLLRTLQNGDRDGEECAAASVILHVYEVMAEKPARQMSHSGGARALIRERGWDARSAGVGSACFWLSVGMEVLCCLAMNWVMTWDPDEWGLETEWGSDDSEDTEIGRERWVHRAFYIVAKVANFRAATPLFLDSDPHDQQARLGTRLAEWQGLKRLCDNWNNTCPRRIEGSRRFPGSGEWLLGRRGCIARLTSATRLTRNSAILGRLFYHTAQCILTQTNPMEPSQLSEEMKALQLHHARQILGIVASSRDCRLMSMAIQAASVASATLVDARERMEALDILGSIQSQPGGYMRHMDRKPQGGWERELGARGRDGTRVASCAAPTSQPDAEPLWNSDNPAAPRMNPLSSASFNHPNHPYKPWYRPVDK
ncbi:Uncharacterized protein TPAR_05088 [Tolypocladium paradoxum]|uniref:Zn(2)-C6 fungal-type domain-containing protein n=1 Tax=Tolypocladium paradoxum TaxID=94208 RepID=A0A2S4KX41_9HYPO|nr:Uncharacterized protein TPAR_05088 [Tolypocladium paradoxum]